MTSAHVTQHDWIGWLLDQTNRQLETDEKKYRELLQPSCYFGYLDGQRRMIRLLETIFSGRQRAE